ncbi:hypothetical protein J4455_02145 [Candidatus Woesearchaeota archaeon]|nr:hypothetical protein [Candidatus Woesearchaeota archaeon]
METEQNKEFELVLPFYKDIINYLIILFSTFILLFIYSKSWIYLPIIFVFIILTIVVMKNRCVNCKRIFSQTSIGKKYIETKIRPYKYSIESKYLYSDGSYKNSKFSEQKEMNERIEIYHDTFNCKVCSFEWFKLCEVNLDKENRPSTENIITTHLKAPRRCVDCDGRLGKGRIKYCSKCRPTYSRTV